jgi:16S rRNA (cytidine1402-2'-O)-methyltransferase
MAGTLYVVATPIGNLEDITLRALRVLRESTVIAAEDTRRTAGLLARYDIATPTISFHAHNARFRAAHLLRRLETGDNVALVTDAGTPGISDPGVELVRACHERRIPVDPVPGPSAMLAALVGSGFTLDRVTFLGFPPSRSLARERWVRDLASVSHTVVLFEAPHRIRDLLARLAEYSGERLIVVARELTKLHQEFIKGRPANVLTQLNSVRGEFTIVLEPIAITSLPTPNLPEAAALAEEFGRLTKIATHGRRAAIAAMAKRYQRPAREIYALVENGMKSVK